jgi:predicted nucleotidyltransferase
MIPTGLAITESEWQIVQAILMQHLPEREVWAFGSRVLGKPKPFSDLDLAVHGAQPLPAATLADLTGAFTESDLPYKVDIVDWATTSERFRVIIAATHVVLLTGRLATPR